MSGSVSDKIVSVLTIDFLKSESAKGNCSDLDYFLGMVLNVVPLFGD